MLTDDEIRAVRMLGETSNLVVRSVIGRGTTSDADHREWVAMIHVCQQFIMSQSAARAHPDEFRLLGETLPTKCSPLEVDTIASQVPITNQVLDDMPWILKNLPPEINVTLP